MSRQWDESTKSEENSHESGTAKRAFSGRMLQRTAKSYLTYPRPLLQGIRFPSHGKGVRNCDRSMLDERNGLRVRSFDHGKAFSFPTEGRVLRGMGSKRNMGETSEGERSYDSPQGSPKNPLPPKGSALSPKTTEPAPINRKSLPEKTEPAKAVSGQHSRGAASGKPQSQLQKSSRQDGSPQIITQPARNTKYTQKSRELSRGKKKADAVELGSPNKSPVSEILKPKAVKRSEDDILKSYDSKVSGSANGQRGKTCLRKGTVGKDALKIIGEGSRHSEISKTKPKAQDPPFTKKTLPGVKFGQAKDFLVAPASERAQARKIIMAAKSGPSGTPPNLKFPSMAKSVKRAKSVTTKSAALQPISAAGPSQTHVAKTSEANLLPRAPTKATKNPAPVKSILKSFKPALKLRKTSSSKTVPKKTKSSPKTTAKVGAKFRDERSAMRPMSMGSSGRPESCREAFRSFSEDETLQRLPKHVAFDLHELFREILGDLDDRPSSIETRPKRTLENVFDSPRPKAAKMAKPLRTQRNSKFVSGLSKVGKELLQGPLPVKATETAAASKKNAAISSKLPKTSQKFKSSAQVDLRFDRPKTQNAPTRRPSSQISEPRPRESESSISHRKRPILPPMKTYCKKTATNAKLNTKQPKTAEKKSVPPKQIGGPSKASTKASASRPKGNGPQNVDTDSSPSPFIVAKAKELSCIRKILRGPLPTRERLDPSAKNPRSNWRDPSLFVFGDPKTGKPVTGDARLRKVSSK